MIQAARSLRTKSHRSRQTGIAEGDSFFLSLHACTFTLTPLTCTFTLSSFFFPVLSNAHKDKCTQVFGLCCYPPASPRLLPVLAISQPFAPCCRCDRGAVRASQSAAVMLSQSDRATGGNAANKQPVILPCPFTSSSLSKQSADRVGKSTDSLKHVHTQACTRTHKYSIHTAVCIIIG